MDGEQLGTHDVDVLLLGVQGPLGLQQVLLGGVDGLLEDVRGLATHVEDLGDVLLLGHVEVLDGVVGLATQVAAMATVLNTV